MALKTVLDTLEGVDDAAKTFYKEADGKFVLDVEGIDDHPEVRSLSNAYSRTKADREAAKAETAALKSQIAELQKGAPDTAATQARLAQLQEQLEAAKAAAGEWQGKYTGITRDQSLQQALQSAGINEPAFVKAATAMLSGQVKLGDDGTAFVETAMGPRMVGDFVKQWAASEGKAFVSPPVGGGAKGGNGAGGSPLKGNLAGTQKDRLAAIREKFPDLPA